MQIRRKVIWSCRASPCQEFGVRNCTYTQLEFQGSAFNFGSPAAKKEWMKLFNIIAWRYDRMLYGWPKHHGTYENSFFTVLNKNPVGCPSVSLKGCSFICLETVSCMMEFFFLKVNGGEAIPTCEIFFILAQTGSRNVRVTMQPRVALATFTTRERGERRTGNREWYEPSAN